MENNYKEYLDSYAWKAIKKMKLEEQPNCECCGEKATTVHHLSYERRGSEREDDIVSICESCHHECHFVNGYQIKNDEVILRKRFEEVKGLKLDNCDDKFEYNENKIYKNGNELKYIHLNLYHDGYYVYKISYDYDDYCEYLDSLDDNDFFSNDEIQIEIERKKTEWMENGWDYIENNGSRNPVYDGYDYDSYVYGKKSNDYIDIEYVEEKRIKEEIMQVLFINGFIDEKVVFVNEQITITLVNIKKDNLEFFTDYYYRFFDKIYFIDTEIIKVDINSFFAFNNIYAKDKYNVYVKGNILEGVDINSFEVLNDEYTKDKNYAYHNGEIIEGSDGRSFEVIDYYNSKDKNYKYYEGKIIK